MNAIDEVQNKVAIVTGAANGIGRATVELLHAGGALVVTEDIDPAVKDVFKGQDRIVPYVGDVASEEAARSVVAGWWCSEFPSGTNPRRARSLCRMDGQQGKTGCPEIK